MQWSEKDIILIAQGQCSTLLMHWNCISLNPSNWHIVHMTETLHELISYLLSRKSSNSSYWLGLHLFCTNPLIYRSYDWHPIPYLFLFESPYSFLPDLSMCHQCGLGWAGTDGKPQLSRPCQNHGTLTAVLTKSNISFELSYQYQSHIRADSMFAPSQWEMSLQSNAISHWLCTNLQSALYMIQQFQIILWRAVSKRNKSPVPMHWSYISIALSQPSIYRSHKWQDDPIFVPLCIPILVHLTSVCVTCVVRLMVSHNCPGSFVP